MVPAKELTTAKRTRYQRYLASREWSLIREKVRERSGDRCEHCCGAPQQAVHHLTYARVGNERLGDLLAVCEPCHDFLSGKSDVNPLLDVYVVSPAIPIYDLGSVHWLLLAVSNGRNPVPPVRRYCADDGCIWCGYVDEEWAAYVEDVWMPGGSH